MTTATIITMTIILTGIWGGFAVCLWYALRLARQQQDAGRE